MPISDDALQRLTDLVQPSLRQCGVELFELQWSEGARPVLRVVIERPGGVSLDDCGRVSQALGAVLDAYDPIPQGYELEVTSPGAERPLRDLADWRRHLGSRVNVRYRAGDADVVLEGTLLSVADDAVEVEVRERRGPSVRRVAFADMLAGRLAVAF